MANPSSAPCYGRTEWGLSSRQIGVLRRDSADLSSAQRRHIGVPPSDRPNGVRPTERQIGALLRDRQNRVLPYDAVQPVRPDETVGLSSARRLGRTELGSNCTGKKISARRSGSARALPYDRIERRSAQRLEQSESAQLLGQAGLLAPLGGKPRFALLCGITQFYLR